MKVIHAETAINVLETVIFDLTFLRDIAVLNKIECDIMISNSRLDHAKRRLEFLKTVIFESRPDLYEGEAS